MLLQHAQLQNALTQMATGLRINTAADDPAGLAISERLRSHIAGANALLTNASRAVNLVQTAEGVLLDLVV
jgi:flagellin